MSARGDRARTEYCLEFDHDGCLWGLNFHAVDYEDAVAKVESVKRSLRLLGPLAFSCKVDNLAEGLEKAAALMVEPETPQ